MIIDHKKYDLFGKTLVQKVVIKPPFQFTFPIADNACFLYMLEGEMQYQVDDEQINIPCKHSLFLNCINSQKQISSPNSSVTNEIVIVNFHPDVLKRIYDREIPLLLQAPQKLISNKSTEIINPANYIKTKRLEKAAELLLASNQRITDIAFECGFKDLANFTKSFHDKYNVTPTNYRLNRITK